MKSFCYVCYALNRFHTSQIAVVSPLLTLNNNASWADSRNSYKKLRPRVFHNILLVKKENFRSDFCRIENGEGIKYTNLTL